MNPLIKKILWPVVCLRRIHENYLRKNNPEKLFSIWYKRATGAKLNIDNPKSMYDKIAYLAFRTDTSEWSRLADKVRVREYVKECGYGQYLPKLYGVYESSKDIDYSKLPQSFVIKTNNASATNILVKDKNKIDVAAVNNQLDEWLKIDYGYRTAQPHYSRIKPLILAEEYLIDNAGNQDKVLIDYKFYCVNGEPLYLYVYTDRVPNTHIMKRGIYDMSWIRHDDYSGSDAILGEDIKKPVSFDLMKEIAKKLAASFPFVRVDFYEINGKPIFGEMTFTPGMQASSEKFLNMVGKIMKI